MPQSLYRSLLDAPAGGGQLPQPFGPLASAGAYIRRGQVCITAAAPGGGKTALWTNYVVANDVRESVGILYFSPDSDIMTVGPRLLGTMQGKEVRQVFGAFTEQGANYTHHMEYAKSLKHIQWCFDSSPTYDDIELEIDAYAAVHGRYPDLIILDNIRDVWSEDFGEGGEYQRHSGTVDYFKDIASKTNAAVVLLHHLTGQYEDSKTPAGLGALQGKIGKNARLVLTLFSVDDFTIGVVVAKNSNGKASPAAEEWHVMNWNKETQVID
jgi:hypothetical protein